LTNGALGTFDPTVLLNGTYELQVVASDASGRSATASRTLVVQGDQKVGNFNSTFTDLQVPAAGLPIQVTRTYDSRDKGQGDFGIGWRLGLSSVTAQANGPVGLGWLGTTQVIGFIPQFCISPTQAHVVTVTFPDGTTFKFQPTLIGLPANGCSLFPEFLTLGYQALPGTNGSLVPLNGANLLIAGGFQNNPIQLLDQDTLSPSDPTLFQLTLDGRPGAGHRSDLWAPEHHRRER
jgi:hypothetical protein